MTIGGTVPGPPRKPLDQIAPATLRSRAKRDRERVKREAELAAVSPEIPASPMDPPAPPPDDIDTGGAGRVEIRREVARLMAAEGKSSSMAVDAVCELFGIEDRQAWRYVRAVRKAWAEVEAEERPSHRAWLLQVQSGVLADARTEKDHKAANGAIRNLIDLLGLKVSKVELQEGGLDALVAALSATPAQREDEIAKLEAEAQAAGLDPATLEPASE